jgi:hypothetical protein
MVANASPDDERSRIKLLLPAQIQERDASIGFQK